MTGVALAVFGATALAARRGRIGAAEAAIFRGANDLPEAANMPLQVVMQFGSFGSIWVTSAAAARSGSRREAAALAVAGTAVWAACKGVKRVIGRDRPAGLSVDTTIRGRPQDGLGFPSGHTAVAVTLAAMAAPGRSTRAAAALWGAAATVAVARMYVGAHLPLDVAGGAALGIATATAARRALHPGRRP